MSVAEKVTRHLRISHHLKDKKHKVTTSSRIKFSIIITGKDDSSR